MAFLEHCNDIDKTVLIAVVRVREPEDVGYVYEAYFHHAAPGLYSVCFGSPGDTDFVTSKDGAVREHFRNVVLGGAVPDVNNRPDDALVLMYYLANGPSSCMQQNIDMFKRMFRV
jgi:hypothetical protein